MRSLNVLKSLAVMMTLSFSAQSLALTDAQKDELYKHGTITVKDGKFEVRAMMGSEQIGEHAIKHWEHAAKLLGELAQTEEFWHKKVVDRFFDGVNYASDCCRDGVCAIPSQFEAVCAANDKICGFGAMAAKLKNWLGFIGTCCGDVCLSAWGIVAGGLYAVVAPAGTILYRPIAAATEAIVAGTVWPAFAYTYNGVAYVMLKDNEEPKQGDFTVTYIPNKIPYNEMAEYNVDL